ncbi:POK9 protein, partial [Oenanthe oenanthe]|nr:POK9 protein [Oenanthe oenanthe]
PGSAGLDISTNNTVTLSDSTVFCLPTRIYESLEPSYHALLIGRPSTSITGLLVLPGVIDADSVGEIKIMAWTLQLPYVVPAGTNIAQLIPFLTAPLSAPPIAEQREGGFGSTGVPQIPWTQRITSQHPKCQCKVILKGRDIVLTGLIYTSADETIIS